MSDLDATTIVLKKPVTLNNVIVSEIIIREPIARMIEMAESRGAKTNHGFMLELLSLSSNVNLEYLRQFSARDYIACSRVMNGFLDDSPMIGVTE